MKADRAVGRVSIVVLNWNSEHLGAAATASALAQDWPDLEVIVVDNASDDDSLDQILAIAPDITVVRNPENLGFGGGMNAGFVAVTGEYFLPLNCDAQLDVDYVSALVPLLDDDASIAAVGGRVGSERVGVSGPLAITPVMRTSSLPLNEARFCDKLNGACPLFRASALDEVVDLGWGPYDASYFVYGEDVDLALTLRRLGRRFFYEPLARADHVRSFGSSPRLADRRGPLRSSTLHNRHRNIVRHGRSPFLLFSFFAAVQDVGFVGVQLLRRDWRVVPDMARAWRGVLRTFKGDRRRRIQLRQLRIR